MSTHSIMQTGRKPGGDVAERESQIQPLFEARAVSGEDILVVEDDSDINEVVCELLRDELYVARGASSLGDARRALRDEMPACMLLDLNLGDGTGEQLLSEVTKAGNGPPCVMMSASSAASRVASRFGITLVNKPFEWSTLLLAVSSAIDRGIFPQDHSVCLA